MTRPGPASPSEALRREMSPMYASHWLSRVLFAFLTTLALLSTASVTSAQAAGPEFTVAITHTPNVFQRGDAGDSYTATITNSGDAATSGTITVADIVPAGFTVTGIGAGSNFICPSVPDVADGAPLVCTSGAALSPGSGVQAVTVAVSVGFDAPDTIGNTATVSGGGAASSASTSDTAPVVDRPIFGVPDFTARALDATGQDYVVAGGHPYEASSTFSFPMSSTGYPVEDVKDVFTELPPGFVGNVAAAPRCKLEQLQQQFPTCPPASKIGVLYFGTIGNPPLPNPLYNVVPERGYAAEFGFKFFGDSVVMYPQLRPRTGQYGVTVAVPGAARLHITSLGLTLWGVPSARNGVPGQAVPLLTNPADCLVARPATKIIVDSWQHPAPLLVDGSPDVRDTRWKTSTAEAPPVTGCDAPALASQFAPRIEARPTPETGTTQADAPSGYTVDLSFPQTNDSTDPSTQFDPVIPAAPALKDAVVTLPEGVAVSPSAANGLGGCSDVPGAADEVHYDNTLPVSCADSSKIGTVVATSPLLAARAPKTDEVTGAKPIGGEIYLLSPHPGDLSPTGEGDGTFRALIQVESASDGINAKLPGVVSADRMTGRLTARFENSPQFPIKHVSLTFMSGDRAALVNPPVCGSAKTIGTFTPWSRAGTRSDGLAVPGTPDTTSTSLFEVSWDGRGAGCPASLPFVPQVSAGLADSQAGGSSPLTFDLTREDRQDVVSGVNVTLPEGLLAAVRDVPLCSGADADVGSCPAASRVGSATVAAGSGARPFYLSDQPVSLTGPYKGAPYGLAVAIRAVAGPFDLGTVVVRQALNIDPDNAHVTVVSDPLPTIRDGVPLRVRRIHVVVDRPGFMRSPSSCEAKSIDAGVHSLGDQTANLSVPFQMTDCDKLPFAPRLSMKLTGPSQNKVGGHPGVEALVTQKPGEAGTKALTVTLPLSLALDPNNAASDDLCEFADGLKDQCPQKSVIGTMTAISPLLKAPLTGKVFFVKGVRVSPEGRLIKTLPTLLIELRGEVSLNLRATSSVPDGKHLTTTFASIPDAPLSSAFLKLNGGKKGILVVTDGHDDICYSPQKPFLAAQGQNGKRLDTTTTLTPECPLAVVSRTFTSSSIRVRVSGIGAGAVTISGTGIRTTRRTISSATSATITARLTAKGKRMHRAKQDVRVKVSFTPKGTKKAKTASSPKPKKTTKKN
jgi:uncharacterized repeat protein (TIGR01451 family)